MKTIKCKICGKIVGYTGLGSHLKHKHKWKYTNNNKQYYDTFLISNNENICNHNNCSNSTTFTGINTGYLKYCSTLCLSNAQEVKDKREHTCIKKYNCNNPSKNKTIINKIKQKKFERYGEETYGNPKKISSTLTTKYKDKKLLNNMINRVKATKLKKYGDETYHNIPKMIKTKLERGLIMSDNTIIDGMSFKQYRRKVRNLTKKVKETLFESWDGYDYYTKEYIKPNFKYHFLDKKYPSIDHKISIKDGFLNNIPPDNMIKLSNLCITQRGINSKKNAKSISN